MASGKETIEYVSVRENICGIRDYLDVSENAKELLTTRYYQKRWIDITENTLIAVSFVRVALHRISLDASEYHTFMDMLKSIGGMNLVVDEIEATYKEQGIIFEDNLRQTFHQLQTHTMVHFRKDDCLNRMLTKYHHILSNEERIVEAAKVFRIFKTYWNFVDYSLLKHSIKEFGTNKLRSEMKKYIADLQRFMKGTTIQDYDDFSPPHFPEHFIVVTITQNKDPAEWTLYEVCQFKKELVKQSNEHAILTKIKKSRSVEIVFAFPPHALTKIYGVFNADFQEKHNIIEVTFNWRLQEIDYTCIPLTPSNAMKEVREVWDVSESGSLADRLCIPKSKQEEIRKNFPNDESEQKKQSLAYWINTDPLASWMRLDQMRQAQLADSPQPSGESLTDPNLTTCNLRLALEALPDTQWKVFGKMIEIPKDTMERLESKFHTAGERKAELLRVYVTEHHKPTWEHVSDALCRMRDEQCHKTLDILQSNLYLMRWQMGRTI